MVTFCPVLPSFLNGSICPHLSFLGAPKPEAGIIIAPVANAMCFKKLRRELSMMQLFERECIKGKAFFPFLKAE
jgi:hypothetical protein